MPPIIHALKNIKGVPDFAAMVAGVLKIPMPITKLTTIMVRLKKLMLCFVLLLINECLKSYLNINVANLLGVFNNGLIIKYKPAVKKNKFAMD
jgi:hypothetical protein